MSDDNTRSSVSDDAVDIVESPRRLPVSDVHNVRAYGVFSYCNHRPPSLTLCPRLSFACTIHNDALYTPLCTSCAPYLRAYVCTCVCVYVLLLLLYYIDNDDVSRVRTRRQCKVIDSYTDQYGLACAHPGHGHVKRKRTSERDRVNPRERYRNNNNNKSLQRTRTYVGASRFFGVQKDSRRSTRPYPTRRF